MSNYANLIKHLKNISTFICTIAILIGLVNSFTKFLPPLSQNLFIGALVLSGIGLFVADLYSLIQEKNSKSFATKSISIFKQVFVVASLFSVYFTAFGLLILLLMGVLDSTAIIYVAVLASAGAFDRVLLSKKSTLHRKKKNMLKP